MCVQVERELRMVGTQAPGSNRESDLMNEHLALVNERNMLVRQEDRLNVLETIREQETAYKAVEQTITQLLTIDGENS
jgi:hypothetical protein